MDVVLVDMDAGYVPVGLDFGFERREEVFVFLLAHAGGTEDRAFGGEGGDEGVPLYQNSQLVF